MHTYHYRRPRAQLTLQSRTTSHQTLTISKWSNISLLKIGKKWFLFSRLNLPKINYSFLGCGRGQWLLSDVCTFCIQLVLDCRLIILATLLQLQPWMYPFFCQLGRVFFFVNSIWPIFSHVPCHQKCIALCVLMLMSKTRMLCAHCLRGNRRRRLTMGNRFRSSNNEINYRIVYRWSPSRPFIFTFVSRMIMTLLDTNSIALKQHRLSSTKTINTPAHNVHNLLCAALIYSTLHSLLQLNAL